MTSTHVNGFARGGLQRNHQVSIPIGHKVGCVPAAKVSMMIMRPPQRGQAHGNWRSSVDENTLAHSALS
jgi:hypothetical protein